MFASNITIQSAAAKVFKKRIDATAIANPRQRPDLIFLKDATVSMTATEAMQDGESVVVLRTLLLLELKKGKSTIKLAHLQQAQNYVQDLMRCGLLDGPPFIHAYVIGYEVSPGLTPISMGDEPRTALIKPVTFGQLVRTAETRLFRLQDVVAERHANVPADTLVERILGEPRQQDLDFPDSSDARDGSVAGENGNDSLETSPAGADLIQDASANPQAGLGGEVIECPPGNPSSD